MSAKPSVRTPDSRFKDLPGFTFSPNYIDVDGLRLHYIDEKPGSSQETILCLHGEPTWSYLYRKMVPILAKQYRVLALDFIGFGRSDKLTEKSDYIFQLHKKTLRDFIHALDLNDLTLVVQDWGGLIGLTFLAEEPDLFARIVILNTGLPTGEIPMPDAFLRWRKFVERLSVKIPIRRVIKAGLAQPDQILPEVLDAYEAPFPDETYKVGAAVWPLMVPLRPDDPGAEEMRQAKRVLSGWKKPALVMFSDSDPIMAGGDNFFRKLIPTANDQPKIVIERAGHYLQEEKGEEIAGHIVEFISCTPL